MNSTLAELIGHYAVWVLATVNGLGCCHGSTMSWTLSPEEARKKWNSLCV